MPAAIPGSTCSTPAIVYISTTYHRESSGQSPNHIFCFDNSIATLSASRHTSTNSASSSDVLFSALLCTSQRTPSKPGLLTTKPAGGSKYSAAASTTASPIPPVQYRQSPPLFHSQSSPVASLSHIPNQAGTYYFAGLNQAGQPIYTTVAPPQATVLSSTTSSMPQQGASGIPGRQVQYVATEHVAQATSVVNHVPAKPVQSAAQPPLQSPVQSPNHTVSPPLSPGSLESRPGSAPQPQQPTIKDAFTANSAGEFFKKLGRGFESELKDVQAKAETKGWRWGRTSTAPGNIPQHSSPKFSQQQQQQQAQNVQNVQEIQQQHTQELRTGVVGLVKQYMRPEQQGSSSQQNNTENNPQQSNPQ